MKLLSLFFLAIAVQSMFFSGMRSSLSMQAFNNMKSKYLPSIISSIQGALVEDLPLSFMIGIIPAKIYLTNVTVTYLTLNEASTIFSTGNSSDTVYLTISDVSLQVQANYKYQYPIFTAGTVSLVFNNSNIVIPTKVYVKDGKIETEIGKMIIPESTSAVNFKPTGPISNFFGKIFKMWPLHQVFQHICLSVIGKATIPYNKYLEQLFSTIHYTENLTNLTITGDYYFFNSSVSNGQVLLYQNGTFFVTNSPSTLCPVVYPSFVPNFQSTHSLRIQLNSYFFDTFVWSIYASNRLNFFFTSEQISTVFPYTFTTSGLNSVIPGLKSTYGPNIPVDLECSFYNIPDVSITNTITMDANVYCDFLVRVTPSVSTTAFRILAELEANIVASLQTLNNTLYLVGNIDETKTMFLNFVLANSNIGNFNVAGIQKAVNYYIYDIVILADRVFNNQGIALPVPKDIVLTQPSLMIYNGAIEVSGEPLFR